MIHIILYQNHVNKINMVKLMVINYFQKLVNILLKKIDQFYVYCATNGINPINSNDCNNYP